MTAPDSLTIARLHLSHFRSHRFTDIETDGRPVVLHGPNGAGKTNILEAISLLSPGRGLRRAGPEDMARRQEAIGWKVSANLSSPSGTHEIETGSQDNATRLVQIDGKPTSQLALARAARVLWLVPVMDRLWLEGAGDRRQFLDRIVMSFLPEHAEASLSYEKAMRERNRLLKDQVNDRAWFDALEGQMASSGAAIALNRTKTLARLAQAQVGAQTAFPVAELSIAYPEEMPTVLSADALRTALANSRSRDLAAGRTLVGPHRADLNAIYAAKNVAARLCSTGEQKALLVSLILANARALKVDFAAPPILLLDEVAAHLDGDRRAALYDEVCALQAQAWMTGTGPELFEPLRHRAQWFSVRDGTDGSQVLREEANA